MAIRKNLKPIECGLFEAEDGSIWFIHPHTQRWLTTDSNSRSTIYARLLRLAKRYKRKTFVFEKQTLEVL